MSALHGLWVRPQGPRPLSSETEVVRAGGARDRLLAEAEPWGEQSGVGEQVPGAPWQPRAEEVTSPGLMGTEVWGPLSQSEGKPRGWFSGCEGRPGSAGGHRRGGGRREAPALDCSVGEAGEGVAIQHESPAGPGTGSPPCPPQSATALPATSDPARRAGETASLPPALPTSARGRRHVFT